MGNIVKTEYTHSIDPVITYEQSEFNNKTKYEFFNWLYTEGDEKPAAYCAFILSDGVSTDAVSTRDLLNVVLFDLRKKQTGYSPNEKYDLAIGCIVHAIKALA